MTRELKLMNQASFVSSRKLASWLVGAQPYGHLHKDGDPWLVRMCPPDPGPLGDRWPASLAMESQMDMVSRQGSKGGSREVLPT